MRLGRKGFTLVELIIVVIIVGILAAVAVPMMTANVTKAKKSEAVSAMGTIRTAERLYYAEWKTYINVAAGDWAGGAGNLSTYIGVNDLNGKYFDQSNYAVTGASASAYTITATVPSTVGGSSITMDQTGTISNY